MIMSKLKVIANISKGSPITGSAWIDILCGGTTVVEHAEITAPYNPDPALTTPNPIEFTIDYDGLSHLTLTIANSPETIGPIQIYNISFYLDEKEVGLTWQNAIKCKPIRFGGQPNVTITNPHVGDPEFSGWCSVPDVSPGMSITWGLTDLVNMKSPV